MGKTTSIEWADHTMNPWIGCSKVSAGCANCYAETLMDKRWKKVKWGKGAPRKRTSAANWREPLKWDREAAAAGVRRRVFCASLADVFDQEVDNNWRVDLFSLIHRTQNLDWLILTKRPQAMKDWVEGSRHMGLWGPPANIWLGVSVEDQETADERIPVLLGIPAAIHFVSYEPALGPVDVTRMFRCTYYDVPFHGGNHKPCTGRGVGLDWIIVGGESGSGARPLDINWARSTVHQCREGGIACFVKQDSGQKPGLQGRIPDDLFVKEFPQ